MSIISRRFAALSIIIATRSWALGRREHGSGLRFCNSQSAPITRKTPRKIQSTELAPSITAPGKLAFNHRGHRGRHNNETPLEGGYATSERRKDFQAITGYKHLVPTGRSRPLRGLTTGPDASLRRFRPVQNCCQGVQSRRIRGTRRARALVQRHSHTLELCE